MIQRYSISQLSEKFGVMTNWSITPDYGNIVIRVRVRITLQLTASSQFVLALSRSDTHDKILTVVKTVAVLFALGRSPCQEDGFVMK